MNNIFKTIIIFLMSLNLYANSKIEQVTVQLDWKYQFQYAGFIAADEKGFYKDAGFDVKLVEYKKGINTVDTVLSGRADFGIYSSSLIIKNKKLLPVVTLATYLHQSPSVLVMQPNIRFVKDLLGKKIMATKDEFTNGPISFLLEYFGINKNNTTFVEHTFDIEDFKNKKVDAMSAYLSNEIYELEKENIFYTVVNPSDYGYVTNALNLFTSYENVKKNPQRIQRFIDATNKGWKYALEHVDEIINILFVKYQSQKSPDALAYEAKILKQLMLLNLYKIGQVDENLIKRLHSGLIQSGKLSRSQKLEKYFYSQMIKNFKSNEMFFTPEERDYIAKKGTIKMCTDPDWLPFSKLENGKYIGMLSEYLDFVKANIHLNIEIYPTKSWTETLNAFKSGKCDIIDSAAPTQERLAYMDFTKAYMQPPIALVTTMDKSFVSDISNIKEKKLGITKGYSIIEVLKKRYPGINIVEVKNVQDGLQKVESGELYGYFDNLVVAIYNIQQGFQGSLKISARLDEVNPFQVGLRKDEPILKSIFNKAIDSVDTLKRQEILTRWIGVKEEPKIDYTFLWEVMGVIVCILLLIMAYSLHLKISNKKLAQVSREDALTKIGNRLSINEILEDRYQQSIRYKDFTGIALFDIDDFKKINDVHGHLAGDDVLKKFSAILSENIRKTDKVGRWGGEEFLVICSNTNKENLRIMAENLRQKIENYDFSLGGQSVTTSIGLAVFDGLKDIEEVLNEADENLYKAKASGKNRVC